MALVKQGCVEANKLAFLCHKAKGGMKTTKYLISKVAQWACAINPAAVGPASVVAAVSTAAALAIMPLPFTAIASRTHHHLDSPKVA